MRAKDSGLRRAITVPLLLPVIASVLLVLGHFEALTSAQRWVSPLIEAGKDADGVYASVTRVDDRTVVLLTGFIGSPTRYSELLQICNGGDQSLTVMFEAVETMRDGWTPRVFNIWLVKPDGRRSLFISLPLLTRSAPIELEPGECARVEVEVLVPANASASEAATFTIRLVGA